MIISKEFKRFVLTGIVNTVVYYMIFSSFIYLDVDYKIAVFLATSIGVFFSFKTFGKFVFSSHDNRRIFRFISVYIVLYFINIFIIKALYLIVENYYIIGFIATIICALISFVFNKWFVFKEGEKSNE